MLPKESRFNRTCHRLIPASSDGSSRLKFSLKSLDVAIRERLDFQSKRGRFRCRMRSNNFGSKAAQSRKSGKLVLLEIQNDYSNSGFFSVLDQVSSKLRGVRTKSTS